MAFVLVALGALLLLPVWFADTTGTRIWFLFWALFNFGVALDMAANGFPFAWVLQPQGAADPGYRR